MRKIKIILAINVGLLLIAGLLIFLIKDLAVKRNLAKNDFLVLEKEVEDLNKLVDEFDTLNSNILKLISALPGDYTEFVSFIEELSTISTLANQRMLINSQDQEKEVKFKNTTIKKLTIYLELDGSFSSVVNFFNTLYSMPYYTQIEDLTIVPSENGVLSKVQLAVFMR